MTIRARRPRCGSSRSTVRSPGAFASPRARRRASASRSPGTIRWARSTGSIAPSLAIRNMPASRRPGATTMRRNGPIRGRAAPRRSGGGTNSRLRPRPFAIPCSGPRTLPRSSTRYPARLAVLRSATVIRLEGGELWGWEGQHIGEGSCEGSCTHVWNYQQALAWLFPALERTLRETEFTYNQLPNGGLTFRQRLPLGSGFDIIGPCADGHFGATIKAYREWRNSGDEAWLRRFWPNIRKVDRIRLVARQSRPLGSGEDRRAVGKAASHARHGAVRPEFLADQLLPGGA